MRSTGLRAKRNPSHDHPLPGPRLPDPELPEPDLRDPGPLLQLRRLPGRRCRRASPGAHRRRGPAGAAGTGGDHRGGLPGSLQPGPAAGDRSRWHPVRRGDGRRRRRPDRSPGPPPAGRQCRRMGGPPGLEAGGGGAGRHRAALLHAAAARRAGELRPDRPGADRSGDRARRLRAAAPHRDGSDPG